MRLTLREESKVKHITLTREELLSKNAGRTCVCGRSWSWNDKTETGFHCNNTHCTYWNICTIKHSVEKTRLDVLYACLYQKGFCRCIRPKYHTIEDYELCVNDNCFAVLREYKDVLINQSLYPRRSD